MRFLCLVHLDSALRDRAELDRRALAYDRRLRADGRLIAAQAIAAADTAVLLRRRDGELLVTDGPYIESKEQMGGFMLVEAPDMAAAVELAAAIPFAEVGTIEVRPIHQIPTPPPLS